MRAFVVLGLVFFHTKPKDCLGETSPKLPVLCRVGRKTTTHQSINHQDIDLSDYHYIFLRIRCNKDKPRTFSHINYNHSIN